MKFWLVIITLAVLGAGSSHSLTQDQIPQYKDTATSWSNSNNNNYPGLQQQATHQGPPAQEKFEHHYVGPKQGGMIGAPFYGVFPIIFLIGLAAIIIIPLLFFTFSPMGFAGGFGQGAYGRKRSLGDDFDLGAFKRNMVDMIVTVSDAIEKYGGLAAAMSGTDKKKKS
jgi:hypothetical protein